MTVKILLPTALRHYVGGEDTVALTGQSVGEVLSGLVERHPALRPHLFTSDGQLRNFVNVFVNDQDTRHLGRQAAPLAEGDVVSIVPAVAGGASPAVAHPPTASVGLSNQEIERYSRHLIMPEVAVAGQLKLKQAKVLLIGAGGLGSPLALYLAAAGVGRLGLVDFDRVDVTNLQRQVLHRTADVGRPKLASAKEAILGLNPLVQVDTYETALGSENALDILAPYDVVVDGTDNFPTRYLVNDACVLLKKPNVYGSIFRFEGQASVFDAGRGPCYRCLYPEPPPPGLVPSCAEGGVLGILPGVVGLIQATETVKLILGRGESLVGRLLLFDALAMRFRELKLRKDPDCPLCGAEPSITRLIDYQQFCGAGTVSAEATLSPEERISARELKQAWDRGEPVDLLDVREAHEFEISRLPGARLIPLGELPRRVAELDRDSPLVIHCKVGARSAQAVKFLREAGFKNVRNLTGGIRAWSEQVDPSVPRY
ncbi:MAG TPA: molybdopterin-synthase adenylyltransferase MoeB [Vicinamibacteria bacterium]|nr:molybdopterin-synthase adenylyltransferase MoeB [Vicinamibacteria bacterium]